MEGSKNEIWEKVAEGVKRLFRKSLIRVEVLFQQHGGNNKNMVVYRSKENNNKEIELCV